MLSRPYSNRRPSSREDWGVSWVFSSCGSSVVLLTRYNGQLREPLLWRQGSQVSMRVARGSATLLSSHGRGIAPQDALKKDSRGLVRVGAGNPWFPRLVPVISGRSKGASEKSGILCSSEGPLGTPLGSRLALQRPHVLPLSPRTLLLPCEQAQASLWEDQTMWNRAQWSQARSPYSQPTPKQESHPAAPQLTTEA